MQHLCMYVFMNEHQDMYAIIVYMHVHVYVYVHGYVSTYIICIYKYVLMHACIIIYSYIRNLKMTSQSTVY